MIGNHYPVEMDNNNISRRSHEDDTVDLSSVPDVDVPHDQICGVNHSSGGLIQSIYHSSLAKGRIKLAPCSGTESVNYHTNAYDDDGMQSDGISSRSFPTVKENKKFVPINSSRLLDVDTNASAKELSEGILGYNDGLGQIDFQDMIDGSNVSKVEGTKQEGSRPNSVNKYELYTFDPPKPPKSCPKSKRPKKVKSDVSQSEVMDVPKSTVFVTRGPGVMYQLQFFTQNTSMQPLFTERRFSASGETDKQIQPDHYEYRDPTKGVGLGVHVLRQKYALSTEDNQPKSEKPLVAPLRVYTDEPASKRKRSSSELGRGTGNGNVYLMYKGILLRVRTPSFPISSMKMPVSEDIRIKMNKIGMPTTDSLKNKGVIVCRCGLDLLQLQFDMAQPTLTKVELKGSAAVQTEDRMVYIKERSGISGRMCLLALPESTYFYQDPMTVIHRLHKYHQRSNVMPLWKYELMRARIAEKRGATDTETKLQKIFQQTRGSRLCFEGLESIITAQAGLLCSEVSLGQEKYHELLYGHQNQRFQRKRPPQFLVTRSTKNGDNETGKVSGTTSVDSTVHESGASS